MQRGIASLLILAACCALLPGADGQTFPVLVAQPLGSDFARGFESARRTLGTSLRDGRVVSSTYASNSNILALSALNASATAGFVAVAGADLSMGYPDDWNTRGAALVAPVAAHENDLLRAWPNTPVGIDTAVDTKLLLGIRALTIGSFRTVTSIIVVVDASAGMTCHHVAGIAATYGQLVSIPVAERTVHDFGSPDAVRNAIFVNVTSPSETGFVACTHQASRAAAITQAVDTTVPRATADVPIDVFAALQSPAQLTSALVAVNASAIALARVGSVSWLPDTLQNLSETTFVRQCRSDFVAAGHAVAEFNEAVLQGCASMAVIARGANTTVVPSDAAALPGAFRQAVAGAAAFSLPDAETSDALMLGPYDSGCGAGTPVATLSTSTVGASVVHRYSLPAGSSRAACSVDMSVLQRTVYAVQVVTGGVRAEELANALYDGMVAAGLDSASNGLHRVAVFRMTVTDGTLPVNSSEFAAVLAQLQKPLVIGMIGSVGIASEAINRLGVLSLGNEFAGYHLGADAVGTVGYPNDVSLFGSFAGDLALAARYAVSLHGSQAARYFRVSMQPLVARTYRDAIKSDINARLEALGTGALADANFVAEPSPTAPEDRADPSVVLVVGDPDAEPHFSAMLRLVEATPLLVALVPRVVHERAWCQNLLAQWRPTVATDVAGRVVFLDNDEAVHTTAEWRWPESIPRNRTRQARGYLLAQGAAYVAAKTVLQIDRLAVARTAVYHSAVWQAGNLTVTGLDHLACSGLDVEGTMLSDIFVAPEAVTAHGSDDGDEAHLGEHGEEEHADDGHVDEHGDDEHVHDEHEETSPCACNQRTVTRRISSLNGTVAMRVTFNPCNNERPSRVADEAIEALGLYVAAILVVTILVLIRSFVAWRFLRSRNMADVDGDGKELKAATESAEEKMPRMYRIPAPVYMIPVFALPLVLVLVLAQLPIRMATVAARDNAEASESAMGVMTRVLGCTQSSVSLALEVGHGVPSAVRFGFQEKACAGFETFVETSLEEFATALRASEALPARRQQQRSRAVAAAASLAKLEGVRTASSRAAIAIQRSTSTEPRAHVPRIANALVAAEQLLPVVAAILPPSVALGPSPPAPGVSESFTLSDFRAAAQLIRVLLPAEQTRLPTVRAAYTSNAMREYTGILQCIQIAHNRTFNFIDTAVRDECLDTRGLSIANVTALHATITALAANGTTRLSETVLEIDRLYSQKHSETISSVEDAWRARFYTMLAVTFILCAAACVMQSSHTHNFLRAFREIAVLEASVSRWIPIAVLDVMKIDSVHDIDDEPELRELAIVLVDYSRAFAMATKHEDADGALDTLRRVIEAVTSSLADDGEIEHLTTTTCCVLCEHSDSALLAAIELEHAVRSVLYSRIEETRDALGNGDDDDNVFVGVGVHRDTISVGFMGAGKHTFGGAFGHGIRIARLLADLCPVYGAAVIVSSSALDTVDRRTIDLRDLGSIVTRQYGPLPISEAMTMMDRTDLDAFKRETLLDFNRISAAQAAASTPATDDQVQAVAQAVQRCQHFASLSGVSDPALNIKLAWSGKSPADNVAAYVDV